MRAFFNLIFFALVLCCGLIGGYLFAGTGLPVPFVGDRLEALVPAGFSSGSKSTQLAADLEAQKGIVRQLELTLQDTRAKSGELAAQNEQLQAALNNPVSSGIEGSLASDALTNDLIEQNQFLTDELTAIMAEKADLEARMQAAPAATAGGSEAAGALQQQVAQLKGEQQNLIQTLNQALAQRDGLDAQLRNVQSQFQNVVAGVQNGGGDVNALLQQSGVDIQALAEGQAGQVLQNIIQGLGN